MPFLRFKTLFYVVPFVLDLEYQLHVCTTLEVGLPILGARGFQEIRIALCRSGENLKRLKPSVSMTDDITVLNLILPRTNMRILFEPVRVKHGDTLTMSNGSCQFAANLALRFCQWISHHSPKLNALAARSPTKRWFANQIAKQ